jgi:hypothetical protein
MMKWKVYNTILAAAIALYIPGCTGGSDDSMLLLPLMLTGTGESPADAAESNNATPTSTTIPVVETDESTTDENKESTDTSVPEYVESEKSVEVAGSAGDSDRTVGEPDSNAGENPAAAAQGPTSEPNTDASESGAEAQTGAANCAARTVELDPSQGKWFTDEKKGIYTFWANQDLLLRVRGNCAGWYKLKVKVGNIHGPLPDFYDVFHMTIKDQATGREVSEMFIKAKDNGTHMGQAWIYLETGDTDLNLIWTNEAYEKDVYDANIHVHDVSLSKNPRDGI